MSGDGQSETVAFLADPASHDDAGGGVQRIDTHIAHVFLVGERAYKMKRAVRLPFLDFTTLAAREEACRAELALNRRTAPTMYLGLSTLTKRAGGGLEFDGPGEIVEWLVVMRRFDQDRQALWFKRKHEGNVVANNRYAICLNALAETHVGDEAEVRP